MTLWHRLFTLTPALLLLACSHPPPPKTSNADAYAAVARGKIDVEGGLLTLSALRDGRFDSVRVHVGNQVKKGEVLATLDDHLATLEVDMANAEWQKARAAYNLLTTRQPALEKTARRWQQAATAGVAEQQQADDAMDALQQLRASQQVAIADVEAAHQKFLLAQQEKSLLQLQAPLDAEVVQVFVHIGDNSSAQEHTSAFLLLPHKPLLVRAEVNENFLPRLHLGMNADVTLEAQPEKPARKAHVVHISPVLENGRLGEESQMSRVVECILNFDDSNSSDNSGGNNGNSNNNSSNNDEIRNTSPSLYIGQNVLVTFHD